MIELISISPSPVKYKKYRADVIIDGKLYKNVDFGDKRYQQYEDRTGLNLYSNLNHYDKHRRELYHKRHIHDNKPAGLLAKLLLW